MENQLEDAFNDKEISEMRERLSKRPDILKEYDNVIQKISKNEFGEKLIKEMHRLLGTILGDFTVSQVISSINQTCEKFTYTEDCESFIIHKKTMALFNAINKYIVDCVDNTIVD